MPGVRQGLILLLLLAACDQKPAETTPSSKPQPAVVAQAPVPKPPAPKTCAEERGADEARILANRCRMVSAATRPPCHPDNSCAMIEAEITRSCANLTDVEECAGPTAATQEGELYKEPITAP